MSEGERQRVASAFGPALAAAMHAQTDRRLRAATARVCLHAAHADFIARAGVLTAGQAYAFERAARADIRATIQACECRVLCVWHTVSSL